MLSGCHDSTYCRCPELIFGMMVGECAMNVMVGQSVSWRVQSCQHHGVGVGKPYKHVEIMALELPGCRGRVSHWYGRLLMVT